MMTVAALLSWGQQELSQQDNPQLEAQLLLAHVLTCERVALYTWPDKLVTPEQAQRFRALVSRRKQHEPIAYLIGEKEFWSLSFKVTPSTLIPRPETELLIEVLLQQLPVTPLKILDVGTGSGIIACALASERPQWQIIAVDNSTEALNVAAHNAARLKLSNITFKQSNWLEGVKGQRFDAIVSNPPYIAADEKLDPDLFYEPQQALYAGPNGYEAFTAILSQSQECLQNDGLVAFEHGCDQGQKLRELMQQSGLSRIQSYRDLANHERVTIGCKDVV